MDFCGIEVRVDLGRHSVLERTVNKSGPATRWQQEAETVRANPVLVGDMMLRHHPGRFALQIDFNQSANNALDVSMAARKAKGDVRWQCRAIIMNIGWTAV